MSTVLASPAPAAVRLAAPDLTQRAPRSPRTRLGGYSQLPRLLDKCRASLAGTIGEYHFNCPRDQLFFAITQIDAGQFKAAVATGKGDSEMLAWVGANAGRKLAAWEIAGWSAWLDDMPPTSDAKMMGYFTGEAARLAPDRQDIHSWTDLLDLDDHCSFGGKA